MKDIILGADNSVFLTRLTVAPHSLPGSVDLLRSGNHPDMRVPLLHQKIHRRTNRRTVVYTDRIHIQSLNLPVNQNHGLFRPDKLPEIIPGSVNRKHHESVYPAFQKKIDSLSLPGTVCPAVAYQHGITVLTENILDFA